MEEEVEEEEEVVEEVEEVVEVVMAVWVLLPTTTILSPLTTATIGTSLAVFILPILDHSPLVSPWTSAVGETPPLLPPTTTT